jgi:hypothetical protein
MLFGFPYISAIVVAEKKRCLCFMIKKTHFQPKKHRKDLKHLDKLINGIKKTIKTTHKLEINPKPKIFSNLDMDF